MFLLYYGCVFLDNWGKKKTNKQTKKASEDKQHYLIFTIRDDIIWF